jgi:hypothetical protein
MKMTENTRAVLVNTERASWSKIDFGGLQA